MITFFPTIVLRPLFLAVTLQSRTSTRDLALGWALQLFEQFLSMIYRLPACLAAPVCLIGTAKLLGPGTRCNSTRIPPSSIDQQCL